MTKSTVMPCEKRWFTAPIMLFFLGMMSLNKQQNVYMTKMIIFVLLLIWEQCNNCCNSLKLPRGI